MKTNEVKGFVNKVDEMIPDVTMETVKEDGIDILGDIGGAIMHTCAANVCLGSAILKAAPFGVKVVKTTAKKGCLKFVEAYNNRTVVAVWK